MRLTGRVNVVVRSIDRDADRRGPPRVRRLAEAAGGQGGRRHGPCAVAAKLAVDELRADPPRQPLPIVWGHTHAPELTRAGTLTTLNPGSLGGGGTANLAEGGGEIGLARLVYCVTPHFEPLAADLVQIDPGNGAAQAQRHRLDEPLNAR